MTPNTPDSAALLESLETLRTRLADAVAGYDEALEHAEPGIAPELQSMRAAHDREIRELGPLVAGLHGDISTEGSWMTTVQEAVMKARAWLTGIDAGVIPAVVRGERSLLSLYDDAIEAAVAHPDVRSSLTRQRADLERRTDALDARGRASAT